MNNILVIHHCPGQPSVYHFRELGDIVLFPGYGYAARLSVSTVLPRRDAPPEEVDNIAYYAGKDPDDYVEYNGRKYTPADFKDLVALVHNRNIERILEEL